MTDSEIRKMYYDGKIDWTEMRSLLGTKPDYPKSTTTVPKQASSSLDSDDVLLAVVAAVCLF